MTTRILVARHGNTFRPDEIPTRVGCKTDLPLVEEERARLLGERIKNNYPMPVVILAAPLKRTMQTALIVAKVLKLQSKIIQIDHRFIEIDYGPDENKTEDEVMYRLGCLILDSGSDEEIMALGKVAIDAWNRDAIVPDGWLVDPKNYIDTWLALAKEVEEKYKDQTVLIISSNGIMRFLPYLTGDFEGFSKSHNIKVTTGGLCVFEKEEGGANWTCTGWNLK